jgi:RNA polymerase sigma factor (sigma-70 family)
LTEKELIQQCIGRNALYEQKLFQLYAPKFMSICLRYAGDMMEAEDMLQEGFVRIFGHIHQFKFEGSFEGWMKRILVNVCLKQLQKKRIQFVELPNEDYSHTPFTYGNTYSDLGMQDILRLVAALPDGYRLVFNLNVIEGYSHEEIADLLGIQASTSRSQLVKARKMLQQQINELQKVAV